MSFVGLIAGHIGKPQTQEDFGVSVPDGTEVEREGLHILPYMLAAQRRLIGLGHRCVLLTYASYNDRTAWFHENLGDVLVHCHLNGGKGNYGSVYHDRRSTLGRRLAESIRTQGQRLVELTDFRSFQAYDDRTPDVKKPWLYRSYSCISSAFPLRPVAVLYEPFFLDQPDHQGLLTPEGALRVGEVLADGVSAYLD